MIDRTMRAVLTYGPGDLRYESVETPTPGPGEVLVKVARVGMGINDPTIAEGHWPIRTDRPTIAGHEFVGTVAVLGDGAAARHGVALGERVLAEQVAFCRTCYYCRRGWYHLCDRPMLFGLNLDGGWADYMIFPENSIVHRLPPEISDGSAIALESTSCGIYTVERGGLALGETVVVLGGGFLGLIMVQVCAIMGAGLIIYCEDDDHRLQTGKSLGAHVTLNLRRDDVVAEVRRVTGGLGCDLVVDHGQTEAIELGSKMLRKRGRFVVGAAYANLKARAIEFGAICNQNELTFIGRTMSGGAEANCFARAIEYVRRGAIRLDPVVTHNLPLADFQHALDVSRRRIEHAIKVSMTP
ncbi:MAG: zinc-binding dehydrogenase [Betaproteobacteria bacterium]|nr:zinc-binding dehydrogenase [Betaproteobacteria bacterium]